MRIGINTREVSTVAIIGLGYVGLPLALNVLKAGWKVLGIDSDSKKINKLRESLSYVEDIKDEEIREALSSGRFEVGNEPEIVAQASIIVICVPTPIMNGKPDLSFLESAIESIAPFAKTGALVISESSSYPGTLRNFIAPKFLTSAKCDEFLFAHAPERVDPGNFNWNIRNTPRIVSGLTKKAEQEAYKFYSSFCDKLYIVNTPEVAEAAKMFENTFRQVNIALVNEFGRYCAKVGIATGEVLDAASTKPFGFSRFHHSAGVGGHCIPVDSYYLAESARQAGSPLRIVEIANEVNHEQTNYVIEVASQLLGGRLVDARVLVTGVAYKAKSRDTRESPGIRILEQMKKEGCEAVWHDPLVDSVLGFAKDQGDSLYDLCIQVQFQNDYDYTSIHDRSQIILDCTQAIKKSDKLIKL